MGFPTLCPQGVCLTSSNSLSASSAASPASTLTPLKPKKGTFCRHCTPVPGGAPHVFPKLKFFFGSVVEQTSGSLHRHGPWRLPASREGPWRRGCRPFLGGTGTPDRQSLWQGLCKGFGQAGRLGKLALSGLHRGPVAAVKLALESSSTCSRLNNSRAHPLPVTSPNYPRAGMTPRALGPGALFPAVCHLSLPLGASENPTRWSCSISSRIRCPQTQLCFRKQMLPEANSALNLV